MKSHPRKGPTSPQRKVEKEKDNLSATSSGSPVLTASATLSHLKSWKTADWWRSELGEGERERKMENITASEIAGFGVGTLLLCATIAAPRVDSFISASQRSSLGMCRKCGDLKIIACSTCRGVGLIKEGGLIRFSLVDDLYQLLGGDEPGLKTIPCTKCRAKGHFCCPSCSKAQ